MLIFSWIALVLVTLTFTLFRLSFYLAWFFDIDGPTKLLYETVWTGFTFLVNLIIITQRAGGLGLGALLHRFKVKYSKLVAMMIQQLVRDW